MLTGFFRSDSGLRRRSAFEAQSAFQAQWVFTDRSGGFSEPPFDSLNLATHVGDDPAAVARNRDSVAQLFELPVDAIAFMTAEHRDRVAVVDRSSPDPAHPSDALITTDSGIALGSLAADCVPICLADLDAGVVASVHCGWPGVVAGVVPATIAAMRELGSSHIQAVVGPAVCAACYPVDQARAEEFGRVAPEQVSVTADGQYHVDVRGAVVMQLTGEGVQALTVGGCTRETPSLFSYRRDGLTGRHSGLIVLGGAQ